MEREIDASRVACIVDCNARNDALVIIQLRGINDPRFARIVLIKPRYASSISR